MLPVYVLAGKLYKFELGKMQEDQNFFGESMDEIVFDRRNKRYGAFSLRSQYRKNLRSGLLITLTVFVVATITPLVVNKFIHRNDIPELVFDSHDVVVINPPSVTPKKKEKTYTPPPVSDNTEKEIKAADKSDVVDTASKKINKPSNNGNIASTDTSSKSNSRAPEGGGEPGGKIYDMKSVQRLPEFEGGEEARQKFQQDNLKYPPDEFDNGIVGTTYISMVINTDGSVEQVKVFKSSGNKNFDEEALRVASLKQKWVPGRQNNNAIRVRIVYPVFFNPDMF